MAKVTISRNEYLQLVGILTLARQKERLVNELGCAAHELLTGERVNESNDMDGRISDEIWGYGEGNADRLLKQMKIAVEESEAANA